MSSPDPFNDSMFESQNYLPPIGDMNELLRKDRAFQTALSARNYLLLEKEATQRGIKPYKLTQSVMTLYLHKQLVYIQELPAGIQEQIRVHFEQANKPLVI